eukprot:scaffold1911_cov397-Prasinococcus_capsulatus_cf.AAC.30
MQLSKAGSSRIRQSPGQGLVASTSCLADRKNFLKLVSIHDTTGGASSPALARRGSQGGHGLSESVLVHGRRLSSCRSGSAARWAWPRSPQRLPHAFHSLPRAERKWDSATSRPRQRLTCGGGGHAPRLRVLGGERHNAVPAPCRCCHLLYAWPGSRDTCDTGKLLPMLASVSLSLCGLTCPRLPALRLRQNSLRVHEVRTELEENVEYPHSAAGTLVGEERMLGSVVPHGDPSVAVASTEQQRAGPAFAAPEGDATLDEGSDWQRTVKRVEELRADIEAHRSAADEAERELLRQADARQVSANTPASPSSPTGAQAKDGVRCVGLLLAGGGVAGQWKGGEEACDDSRAADGARPPATPPAASSRADSPARVPGQPLLSVIVARTLATLPSLSPCS